eukprot:PhF_6_TR1552/c0_g1_i2/m.2827
MCQREDRRPRRIIHQRCRAIIDRTIRHIITTTSHEDVTLHTTFDSRDGSVVDWVPVRPGGFRHTWNNSGSEGCCHTRPPYCHFRDNNPSMDVNSYCVDETRKSYCRRSLLRKEKK